MEKINFIRTVRKSGTSLAVSLPPEVIQLLKISEGDFLEVNIRKIKR